MSILPTSITTAWNQVTIPLFEGFVTLLSYVPLPKWLVNSIPKDYLLSRQENMWKLQGRVTSVTVEKDAHALALAAVIAATYALYMLGTRYVLPKAQRAYGDYVASQTRKARAAYDKANNDFFAINNLSYSYCTAYKNITAAEKDITTATSAIQTAKKTALSYRQQALNAFASAKSLSLASYNYNPTDRYQKSSADLARHTKEAAEIAIRIAEFLEKKIASLESLPKPQAQ